MLARQKPLKSRKEYFPVQKMQEKTVTLTPNNRLSRYLRKQFDIASAKLQSTVWQTPNILPLNTWLEICWRECPDPRILLNKQQERLLWQKIITENLNKKFNNLAAYAAKAHKLINDWKIKEITGAYYETEDIITFQQLHKKFKTYCKNKNLVAASELPTLIAPYLSTYNFTAITLAGFDEYSPQLQTLIASIKKTGCLVLESDPNNYQNSVQNLIGFDTPNQEIITSANWAKKIINKDPNSNIGIIVPNLTTLRPRIHQIFTEILPGNKNINISAGIPLNTLHIINLALELLAINETLDLTTLNNLLSSPYLVGAETERSERAQFKQQLQPLAHHEFSVAAIKHLANKHSKNIPLFIRALQNWQEQFATIKSKALSNSTWSQIFAQILQTFGWPGEGDFTDLEATAIQAFTNALHEVAASNLILGKISYKNAGQTLHEIVASSTLQPEPETDAPINIFGTLEAVGINFDYLWVMGLDQESWPPAPQPNPFIPLAMQKKLLLPQASAERELHFSNILINRFKRSANRIIFSYVNQAEDRIKEPSALIVDIPKISIADLELEPTMLWAQRICASKKIEPLKDDNAPQLTIDEIAHIRAGSRLLELQSICPFQAFMEFRLATKEPQKLELGISKIKRGIIIHSSLEKIWREIKNQQTLCFLDPISLRQLIHDSIESSLNAQKIQPPYYLLEKQSLTSLIAKWLEIEKKRSPFQVIATEKLVQINLSSIPIQLRIDRLDQLPSGDILLIDYKTGKNLPTIFDWFGIRPRAPQLPLYSIAIDSIHGLALAQINITSLKFKDVSIDELAIGLQKIDAANKTNNNNLTWPALIKYWRDIIFKIAKDFELGQAKPIPISAQTCKQCSFSAACRIACK